MIAKRLLAALALAAVLAAGWSPSRDLAAQEPAPILLDPPAVPGGSVIPATIPPSSEAPGTSPPAGIDQAAVPTSEAPSLTPSTTPPVSPATDPAALPAGPLPPSTTPLNAPALNPGIAPPNSVLESLPIQTMPVAPTLDPSALPVNVDPAAWLPTSPVPSATLPPESLPLPSTPLDAPMLDPGIGPQLNPLTVPPGSDPNELPPTIPIADPAESNPYAPSVGSSPPTTQVPENAAAPALSAKFLLIERDWENAKDRDHASEIAQALTSGPYNLSQADISIFRRGYAALFTGDGATRLAADLESLGLVRQEFAAKPFDLKDATEGFQALGIVSAVLPVRSRGGESTSQTWNLLVVAKPSDIQAIAFVLPAAPGVHVYDVSIVGWRDASGDGSTPKSDGSIPTPNERYVGSFTLRSDWSALVPIQLPGIEGLTILVGSAVEGPAVRSLGPAGRKAEMMTPLQASASLDVEALVRAYESSASARAIPTIGPSVKDGYTIALRFVKQEDVQRVVQALGTSDLSVDILSTQLQGNGLGTIETQAPAHSSQALYDLVKKTLPNATVQIGIQRSSPHEAGASDRVRNVLSWSPAQKDQIARVEEALKRSDLGIGVVAVQFQGNRALMEIETDDGSAQAVLDLVKKAVPEATVRDEGVERPAVDERQDDGEVDGETVVVRLQYATAAEAAKIIETLKRGDDIRVAVDERTNSLFLSTPQKTKYGHIQETLELLETLDVADESPKVASRDLAFPVDRAASAADLRKNLDRVEQQVKSAAAEARSLSGAARDGKIRSLRGLVTEAFRLRLELQREEAAELRDRLSKIETNLKRRERVEGAVIDRRIEVLLDPALEWPDLSLDEATPTPSSTIAPAAPPPASASATSSDAALQFQFQHSLNRLRDSFSAATTIAIEIARLNDEVQTLTGDGAPPDSELRLALLQRQLDLLRQEFDARHQALQQELAAAKSKLRVAQTSWERLSTLRDTGSVSAEEADRAQAELETAQAELARQEILLHQYEQAKSGMLQEQPAENEPPGAQGSASTLAPSNGAEDPSAVSSFLNELAGPGTVAGASSSDLDFALPQTGDSFSAATTLALGIARLNDELTTLSGDGAPADSEVRLALIQRQLELLRQEFDARYQALKLELEAANAKLRAAQATWERISALRETNAISLEEAERAAADLETAKANVARQEILLQQYERAKSGMPEKTPEGEAAPPSAVNPNAAQSSDADTTWTAPAGLIGTWRMKTYQAADEANPEIKTAEWTFDGKTLRVRRDGAVSQYATAFVDVPEGAPAEFEALRVLRQEPENRDVYVPEFVARFELSGDSLRVVAAKERRLLPPDVAAWKDAIYYEFERVAEAVVPPELIGTWRLKTHVAESAPEAKVTFTTWTFDERTLDMDTSEKNRLDSYEVLSSPDSPGTFQTYKFHEVPAGLALEGTVLRVRYVIEAEGDRLKVAFGGGAGPPETVAPDEGVIYYEFDRVVPASQAATDDSVDDDAGAISLPAESAVGR